MRPNVRSSYIIRICGVHVIGRGSWLTSTIFIGNIGCLDLDYAKAVVVK